jgi:predicted MFS family arabinose efflux permease
VTRREIKLLLPLQAGSLIGTMAGTGMVTLVPAMAESFAVPVTTIAWAVTAYMVPFALVQLFSGAFAQRLGSRRIACVGFIVYALGSLGGALAPTFAVFLLLRLLQGVGAAFVFPVLMALVGEIVPPERLGRAIGAFGMTQTLGLALGPAVAGVIEVYAGWRWFLVALGVFAIVAATAFVIVLPRDLETRSADRGVLALTRGVLAERSVLLLSLAAAGLFFALVGTSTYLTVWLKMAQGLSEERIGLILAVMGGVGIPASGLAGRWVDRLGRRSIALAGMIAYIASTIALWLVPYSFARFSALAALLGGSAAVAWTALNTLAVEIVPELRKPVASIYNALRFSGYAIAPPALGIVYRDDSMAGVYLISAAVVAGAGVLIGRLGPTAAERGLTATFGRSVS